MTAFMVTPTVRFSNTGGWGSFSWPWWTFKVNQKYTKPATASKNSFLHVRLWLT
jgi:hypothetical protein